MFKNTKFRFCFLFILLFSLLVGCGTDAYVITSGDKEGTESSANITDITETPEATPEPAQTATPAPEATPEPTPIADGDMAVHFLDLGQGLSVFVQSGGQNLIYDGGDRNTSSFVVAYLKDQGVTDIDYLISSHYDSDHLAGLIGCLNAFNVDTVIGSDYEHDSNLYGSFTSTAADKGLEVQHPAVGTEFQFGTGKFMVLSPADIVSDSNANSVVIKLENGENSFLLTGDADHNAESVMVGSDLDLESDVLSVSHHGSATATSYDFLQQVIPEFAVISCGQDNQYGLPDKDTMDKLESMDIRVYRSDKQGTVIAISDGTEVAWNQEPCDDYSPGDSDDVGTQSQSTSNETSSNGGGALSGSGRFYGGAADTQPTDESSSGTIVWKSATGSKYHSIPDCGNMNPDNATQITQSQAESMGLGCCKNCF